VKLRGIGFVKEVGFKPGVKERWSYRCTEEYRKKAHGNNGPPKNEESRKNVHPK